MKGRIRGVPSLGAGLVALSVCGQALAQPSPTPVSDPSSPSLPPTAAPTADEAAGAAPSTPIADGTSETSTKPSTEAAPAPETRAEPQSTVQGTEGKAAAPASAASPGAVAAQPGAAKKPKVDKYAGPPTLLGGGLSLGGYGGVTVAYSRFDGDDGVLVGGEGALLFNHRFSIGGAGYGWASEGDSRVMDDGVDRRMQLGYGGVVLRYAFLTEHHIYASAGALVGGGAVAMVPDVMGRHDEMDEDDVDRFFVFEPQLSAHSNVTRWMRVGLQAGYRLTNGISKFGYNDSSMHGPVVGGTFQFGWL